MTTEIQRCKSTCLITGANTGIGKATAIELAKKGFEIIMVVRESEKSQKAFDEIKSKAESDCISIFYADLASFKSIRFVVDEIKKQFANIDILINNAGIFTKKEKLSVDGFEQTLAVNYLAPFLLTNLLLPNMNKNGGRIINLSSAIYKRGEIDPEKLSSYQKFNGEKVYANSKLLINYFTSELAKKLSEFNISVNGVHPGVVGTEIFRVYPKWFNRILNLFISSPEEGAKPVIQLATIPEIEKVSGKYFYKLKEKALVPIAINEDLSKIIWKKSAQITKLNES